VQVTGTRTAYFTRCWRSVACRLPACRFRACLGVGRDGRASWALEVGSVQGNGKNTGEVGCGRCGDRLRWTAGARPGGRVRSEGYDVEPHPRSECCAHRPPRHRLRLRDWAALGAAQSAPSHPATAALHRFDTPAWSLGARRPGVGAKCLAKSSPHVCTPVGQIERGTHGARD